MIFSIITPTYNRAHTLHRVYESIKNQNIQKINGDYIYEWIIVDDGSKDNTKELVKQWIQDSAFSIIYLYQENAGKPHALAKGIEFARGELTLLCDSDDTFKKDTFEIFYNTWHSFSKEEKSLCGGIGVLCEDQYGNRVGKNYPKSNSFVPTIEAVFGWRDKGLGETWAILKTKNLKKHFTIPPKARNLKFIPESFFWSKITFEVKQCSYCINRVQRIYYMNEDNSISENVRDKYPDGFLFESKWFVKKYWQILFRYPKVYIKHLLKYIYFSIVLIRS